MGRLNLYGLRGLTANDRAAWELKNLALISGLPEEREDRIFRNQLFKERFSPNLMHYKDALVESINTNLGVNIDDVLAQQGLQRQTPLSWHEKKENDSFLYKYLGIGDRLVTDEDYLNKIYANNEKYDSAREQLIQKYASKLTDEQLPEEYRQKRDTYEQLKQLSPEQRDRLYADEAFENLFSQDHRWETLSQLHPEVRDALYSNPEFKADLKYTLPGDNPDTRSWGRKAYDGSLRWVANASRVFSGDLAPTGANPIEALIYGGPTGGVIGSLVGAATTRNVWGFTAGQALGSYGLINFGADYDEANNATILDKAKSQSNDIIKDEVLELTNAYNTSAENARNVDPNYSETLNTAWNNLTKDNPLWETFKDKSFAQLTDSLKMNLISTVYAVSEKYGPVVAQSIFNDTLNDLLSDNQNDAESDLARALDGTLHKFSAGFGEMLSSTYRNAAEGIADFVPFLDDETREMWHTRSVNALKGLDEDGNPLPFWLTNGYWDGVDKFGTFNPDEIDNIRYGTDSDEYKDFIANGGTREEWISNQETYGDFKGTGISQYKRIRRTSDQHDWFSKDGLYDAMEMSGYIGNQVVTSLALKKGFGAFDKTLGHATRGVLSGVAKEVGMSSRGLMQFLRGMVSISKKAQGLGIMAGSSVPISVGYAMQTFDEVRRKGFEDINKRIDEEIKQSEEFKTQVEQIQNKYNEAVTTGQISSLDAQNAMATEIDNLYQNMRATKQLEHIDEYQKLDDAANDAYNADFAIEMVRNVGVDMAFKGWLYKDATKMVRGVRPSVLSETGSSWGYGKSLLNTSSRFTLATADRMNKIGNWFGNKAKVFNKYVENEDGTISRNTSLLRNSMDFSKETFKNVWGGFYSNYMDDVTVGFAEGYGLNEYNNYITLKYNPELYDAMGSGFIGNYMAGIHEAGKKAFDPQSVKDGIVGALGSFVSFNPLGAFKYTSRALGKEAFKNTVENDASGLRRSRIERLNDFLGNPILGTIGMVKEQNRATDDRVTRINNQYKKHADKLTSTATLINWMHARQENQDWGGVLNIKDGNEGLGFALLNTLDLLNQTSEGHSTVYANYMQKLQDLAAGNITEEDIQNFINAPENKQTFEAARVGTISSEHGVTIQSVEGQSITSPQGTRVLLNTENGRRQYAADRIQSNAQKLLELNESYRKNRELVEGVFGEFNVNDAAATQLTYSLTMQDSWNNRLKELNKKLTGSERITTEANDLVAYRSFGWASKTVSDLESQIANQKESLEKAKERVAQIKRNKKSVAGRELGDIASETVNFEQQQKSAEDVVKAKERKLKQLTQQKKMYERLIKTYGETFDKLMDKIPEGEGSVYSKAQRLKEIADAVEADSSLQDKMAVLSEDLIMQLNPKQRANMILHPENFNKAQQRVIESLIKKQQSINPQFKEDVRDAAILFDRTEGNTELINNIINDKDAFNRYSNNVAARAIMMDVAAYYNSDEFKAQQQRASDRKELLSHYVTEDLNKQNIIDAVVDYLQQQNPDLDLANTASLLEEFDKAANSEGLTKALNENQEVTLSTPDEEITMGSIRDILQNISEKQVEHKAAVAQRETPTVIPQPTTTTSPTPSGQPQAASQAEFSSQLVDAYKAQLKKADKADVEAIKKAMNEGTAEAFREYLLNHEDGAFRELARHGLRELGEMGEGITDTQKLELDAFREALNSAENTASKPKLNLFDMVDDSQEGPTTETQETHETPAEAATRIAEALTSQISDIFGDGKEDSSTIEFYNPLLWESNSPTVVEIKEMFRALFNDLINRIDDLLAKYQKATASERPKVYFYVPGGWHSALVNKLGDKYNMAKDLPVVAVVEDSEGSIQFELNGPKYTPIGLAPASSYTNEWQNENKGVSGQHRTEPIRKAAMKEGVVVTDKLLTTKKGGKEVLVESSLLKVKKHFPSSMGRNDFKSIADIILNKLGFSTPNTENIFSGSETVKGSSMYTSFRDYFLSKLSKGKSKANGKEVTTLNYTYEYEGTPHSLLVMTMPIGKTQVTVPAGILGNTETVTTLLSVLQQSNAADILLSEGAGRSAVLSYLKDRLNYAIKLNLNTTKISIEDGKYTGLEDLEKALNNAFKSVFNNTSNNTTTWKIEVSDIPTLVEKFGEPVYQVSVNLRNLDTDKLDTLIALDLAETNTEGEELDNYAILDFIKSFLFEEEGKGAYRGESETNRIKGLGWSVDYADMADYADVKDHMEEGNNRMKVQKARAFFDDGILSLTQDSMAGFNALISAPFNIDGGVLSSREVVNTDNAGDMPASTGQMPKASALNTPSMVDVTIRTAESILQKILEYSRQRVEEITKQREAAKQLGTSTKNHLSATTIAGIMYNSEFSEDNPYHIPSTTLGTEVDTFIRDFFLKDAEGNSLFDRNNIDYSKYPSLTKEAIDEMCEGLLVFADRLSARGERIYTEEIVTDGVIKVKLEDGRIIDVPNTGHLDMLTIDSLGKFHIYDMKTFLSEDNFIQKTFENYATQLNVYKNLLENQWGISVDSIHLIPITLNYPKPDSENTYTKEDDKLLLNGEQVQLTPEQARFGITINVKQLIADTTSKVQDLSSELAEKVLKAIGFTLVEIQAIKSNNISPILQKKIKFSNNHVELNLSGVMNTEVSLNLENLSESEKQKVEAIIEQLQRENGETPSALASATVEAPKPPALNITSDLEGVDDTATPNTAKPGSNIVADKKHATDEELLEQIDETKVCYGGNGISVDTEFFL